MGIGSSRKSRKLEVLLWSIAFPGFGQLLNGKYIKGILLITLEILVNVMGNFNKIIILSFNFQIEEAIAATDYMWLMFYPCLYFFAIWDAYKDAGGGMDESFSYLPLVFSAYFVTIGLILSSEFTFFGYLIGPIWLPVIFLPVGLGIGIIIRKTLLEKYSNENV
ncbi:hypothetical protein [Halobacillus trueperi]|uniref:hypothetical protein n=1 Tax=Halobacillus trueperi TaxID=156205 RepID=UPI0037356DE6